MGPITVPFTSKEDSQLITMGAEEAPSQNSSNMNGIEFQNVIDMLIQFPRPLK